MKPKYKIEPIEPNYNIIITSKEEGKTLKLDFNTGKMITSGKLKPDKAAKLFFESLDWYFRNAINSNRERFIKKLKEEIDCWKRDVLDTEGRQAKEYTDGALIAISTIKEKIDKLAGDLK